MIAYATSQIVVNLGTILNILAIILSVVALVITIVGFFASLKFYRDGMGLQNLANDALVKIEEKANSIQTQVSGMFAKTLDAAISNREKVSTDFDNLNEELKRTGRQIVETALKEIGTAGEEQKQKLQEAVNKELKPVQELIETTRQSAEQAASEVIHDLEVTPNHTNQKVYIEKVFNSLSASKPMTLSQIKRVSGLTMTNILKALHHLRRQNAVVKSTREGSNAAVYTINKNYHFADP